MSKWIDRGWHGPFWALTVLLSVLVFSAPAVARVKVGQAAPPFTVTTFDGVAMSLADLKGQVVVLNYWATWCGPCRVELPILDDFYRSHPRRDLKILAVATEDSVPQSKLMPLSSHLSFPLIARLKGSGYGLINNALPTSYVIDRAGIVRYAEAGSFSASSLNQVISPLLAEPPPPPAPAIVTAESRPAEAAPLRPVWVELPGADDMSNKYPAKAYADRLGGRVALNCEIAPDGGLTGCKVLSENPAGSGFGSAALELTPKFRMQTAFADGRRATGARLTIPVRFVPPVDAASLSVPEATPLFGGKPGTARSFGGAGPYYPDAAFRSGISGTAALICTSAPGSGRLSDCLLTGESPLKQDFGAAALVMASRGFMTAQPGSDPGPVRVKLTVPFTAPAHR